MAEHLRAADADTAALQARLDALESETHSLREVLTERLKRDSLDEALPTGRGQRRSRDKAASRPQMAMTAVVAGDPKARA